MTVHDTVHDPVTHGGDSLPESTTTGVAPIRSSRSRWLLPGLLVAVVAGGLVAAGAVSLSTMLYVGLFGGMILMHVGGHGHGGHGAHGGGTKSDTP